MRSRARTLCLRVRLCHDLQSVNRPLVVNAQVAGGSASQRSAPYSEHILRRPFVLPTGTVINHPRSKRCISWSMKTSYGYSTILSLDVRRSTAKRNGRCFSPIGCVRLSDRTNAFREDELVFASSSICWKTKKSGAREFSAMRVRRGPRAASQAFKFEAPTIAHAIRAHSILCSPSIEA